MPATVLQSCTVFLASRSPMVATACCSRCLSLFLWNERCCFSRARTLSVFLCGFPISPPAHVFSHLFLPLQGNGESDELLVSGLPGRKLPPALRNRMPVEATGHEAAALHGDEKPLVIRALETAAFGDQLDDEDGA